LNPPQSCSLYRAVFFQIHHDTFVLAVPAFLLCHDIFVFHRDAIFCYFTIFLNSPRCHLFVASRYFLICTNSFRLNGANTLLSRAPRSFAKPARSFSRRLQHGVSKHSLPFTTIFMSELKNRVCLFHEFALVSRRIHIFRSLISSSSSLNAFSNLSRYTCIIS
jgi:hypothetical protein